MHADGSVRLARAARERHEQTLQRARETLQAMTDEDGPVTLAGVAARAGVSRSWLYTEVTAALNRNFGCDLHVSVMAARSA
jgi:hypothetical protein